MLDELPLLFKSKRFQHILAILTLFGLILFLARPNIHIENLNGTSDEILMLEPHENKTIYLITSHDQIFLMLVAENLILENYVNIEINSSGEFILYRKNSTAVEALVDHISFYNLTIYNPRLQDILVIRNTTNQTIIVQTKLESIITAKMVDFTLQHIGFTIFIVALMALQIITFITTGYCVIENIMKKIVINLTKEKALVKIQRLRGYGEGMVSEIFFPLLTLCLTIYIFIMHAQNLGILMDSSINYLLRIVLVMILPAYFFSAILSTSQFMSRVITIKMLKRRNENFLRIYEDYAKLHICAKMFILIIFCYLVILTILIVCGLDPWTVIDIAILLGIGLYGTIFYLEVKKQFDKTLDRERRQKLVELIEIDTKGFGFFIFVIIILFAAFTTIMPIFSTLTANLVFLDYYPSIFIEMGKTFIQWVNDCFIFIGRIQVPMCLIFTIPYWINRAVVCKYEHKYARKFVTDIIIFFLVFSISEYLRWTAYVFTEPPQMYDITNIPRSVLIGMTAAILKDLLMELLHE